MICLAVVGETDLWEAVACRLHRATVSCLAETELSQPPADCDAILFAGTKPPVISFVSACLAAGKHVTVIASSLLLAETESLQAAAKQAGVQFAFVNPDRYLPSRQLIRQQIETGKFGAPGLVRLHRWESSAQQVPTTPTLLPAVVTGDLDLILWLVGMSPNLVYATEVSKPEQAGRTIQIHLGFPGGLMALIDYSSALPPGNNYLSLSIIGGAGAANADDHHNGQLIYRGHHPEAVLVDEGLRKWVHVAQEVVDSLLSQRDLSEGVTTWLNALSIVSAVRQSLATRRAVTLEGC